jgi:hypothetical protein
MTTSADKFGISITSGPGSSWAGTKSPVGHPILKRHVDRADSCTFVVIPEDVNQNTIDMDEVVRDDIITLTIDGNQVFQGPILDKVYRHLDQFFEIEIFAQGFLRSGIDFQWDGLVVNGYSDLTPKYVDETNLTAPLVRDVSGPNRVVALDIFGDVPDSDADGNQPESHIKNDGTDDHQSAVVFDLPGELGSGVSQVSGLYLTLLDPSDHGAVANPTDVRKDLIVTIEEVEDNDKPKFPGSAVSLRNRETGVYSGSATYTVSNQLKESWENALGSGYTSGTISAEQLNHGAVTNPPFLLGEPVTTDGGSTTGKVMTVGAGYLIVQVTAGSFDNGDVILGSTSGAFATQSGAGVAQDPDLTWTVTSAGGTSAIDITNTTPPAVGFGDNHAQLKFDGTNQIQMNARLDALSNHPDRPWFRIEMAPADTDAKWEITVSVEHGASVEKDAFKLTLDSGNLRVIHNNSSTGDLIRTYSGGDLLYVFVRMDLDSLLFDVFSGINLTPIHDKHYVDLEFLDKDGFTEDILGIYRWDITSDGGSPGELNVGFMSSCGISPAGIGRAADWEKYWSSTYIKLDSSTHSLLLRRDRKYAVRLKFTSTSPANFTKILWARDAIPQKTVNIYYHTDDGGNNWTAMNTGTAASSLIFSWGIERRFSWNRIPPQLYTVNLVNQTVKFIADAVEPEGIFIVSTGFGFPEKLVKVSEYDNPDRNGFVVDHPSVHASAQSHKMTVADVVKYLVGFVSDWSGTVIVDSLNGINDGSDDAVGEGYHDDGALYGLDNSGDLVGARVDTHMVRQMSIMDAIRAGAWKWDGVFSLSADGNKDFTFERMKAIGAINKDSLGSHEYFVTKDDSYDDDGVRILKNRIGRIEENVFTTFIVKGATEKVQVRYINWPLKTALGKELVRPAESFQNEHDQQALWDYAQLLNELYGVEKRGGFIELSDYYPLDTNNRLDTNGIIKVNDPDMEDGSDVGSGTGNVFKIIEAVYNGSENKTTLLVSNSVRNLTAIEKEVEDMRNLLNGSTPDDPESVVNLYTNVLPASAEALGSSQLYMALLYNNGSELKTSIKGVYSREAITKQTYISGGVTYAALTAFFPPGNGVIRNPTSPISKLDVYDAKTGGSSVLTNLGTPIPHTSFVGQKKVYKWAHVGLYVTVWVKQS